MAAPATSTSDPTTDKPPRPRRWIPVSLRMLVAVLTSLGVACAWYGVTGYRQLTAIRELESVPGDVRTKPVGPGWLRDWVGIERMRMFDEVVEFNSYGGP